MLNEMTPQQPVIVRRSPTKLSRLLMEENGKCVIIFITFLTEYVYLFYLDKMLDDDITEDDKLNVQKLEQEFSEISNNYDVFLNNQPTISLTRIDLSEHGIYYFSLIGLIPSIDIELNRYF